MEETKELKQLDIKLNVLQDLDTALLGTLKKLSIVILALAALIGLGIANGDLSLINIRDSILTIKYVNVIYGLIAIFITIAITGMITYVTRKNKKVV